MCGLPLHAQLQFQLPAANLRPVHAVPMMQMGHVHPGGAAAALHCEPAVRCSDKMGCSFPALPPVGCSWWACSLSSITAAAVV